MKGSESKAARKAADRGGLPLTLKELASRLNLSPTTVSLVLNRSRLADSIPLATQERVFTAARRFNYRPNYLARSLRSQRTFTVGVMIPELSDGYSALVLSGIEEYLLKRHYLYLVASHHHQPELVESFPGLFEERCIDGLIAVDTPYRPFREAAPLPVVSVSGYRDFPGVTNVVLDHAEAAELAVQHLYDLGHRRLAVIQGQPFSSDAQIRWEAMREAIVSRGLELPSERVTEMEGNSPSPETGYHAARRLLESGRPFSAILSFNDVSAIGAIRSLWEAGLRVPEDVSVVGFDDIHAAAFSNPALTTVRQPLAEMGRIAADKLLERIEGRGEFVKQVSVRPQLLVRESTGPAPRGKGGRGKTEGGRSRTSDLSDF